MTLDSAITLAIRILLVLLFLPFSALDKVLHFEGAIAQAREVVRPRALAILLIGAGFCVEVIMSAGVVSGVADRAAAFILALYCIVTALLWKRFWLTPDAAKSRELFFDFWKNLAVAGGFLLITFGTQAGSVRLFLDHPLSSTEPYSSAAGTHHE
jgi:putative oxidoreductase